MKKNVKKVENKGIDSTELIMALDELEKERGIKKDYVIESIETALVTAYKRNFDVTSDNVKITLNRETGETHVYEELNVVNEVEDWDTYCKAFEEYNGEAVYFKSKSMRGYIILSNCTMTDLIYDDIHLSCMILHQSGFNTKKLAYRIVL